MRPRRHAALTILELLVALVIIAVLAALALPAITDSPHRGQQLVRALSNMKQLHLATQQMALDSEAIGTNNLGWPGDNGGSFAPWAERLVNEKYLSTNDLCKLLSGPGKLVEPGKIPLSNTNAILVYAVKETSPTNTVFLTSANFTNTPTGGLPPTADAKPFGTHGFVLFHRGGDGLILQARQTGPNYTNIIGAYAPLCR